MSISFIDLGQQFARLESEIRSRIDTVLAHGRFILGPEVMELERELAQFTGVNHAVSCANGTDALLMSLMAYEVGLGDAIFVPTFTFIASAEVISLLGATPVFVDIEKHGFNMASISTRRRWNGQSNRLIGRNSHLVALLRWICSVFPQITTK